MSGTMAESVIGATAVEIRRVAEWARRQLEAGDSRKGTARDLGQMLAAEAALVRVAQEQGVRLKIGLRGHLPEGLLAHPLVPDEAQSVKDGWFCWRSRESA